MAKINIGIGGGGCTGKSTLAAALFARLKTDGLDYDLIGEECRKLKKEFGDYRSPFERIYMWRQQEREELRSTASNGFITDTPLFQFYASARVYAKEPRDELAVRELFRMCMEVRDRYQIIVLAQNPSELPYKTDGCRSSAEDMRSKRHQIIHSFADHFWPDRVVLVNGNLNERVEQVLTRINKPINH